MHSSGLKTQFFNSLRLRHHWVSQVLRLGITLLKSVVN